jgi:hypothetical protein
MIELQLLAALGAFDRAREQILVALPQRLGSSRRVAIAGGVAVGWLARGLTLWSAR